MHTASIIIQHHFAGIVMLIVKPRFPTPCRSCRMIVVYSHHIVVCYHSSLFLLIPLWRFGLIIVRFKVPMHHIQVGPVCLYTVHQATGELHPSTSYLVRVQPWPTFAYMFHLAPQESAYGFLRALLTIFPRSHGWNYPLASSQPLATGLTDAML